MSRPGCIKSTLGLFRNVAQIWPGEAGAADWVKSDRGAVPAFPAGPFPPARSPNRTCSFHRIRLSTSPPSYPAKAVFHSSHGVGILWPR